LNGSSYIQHFFTCENADSTGRKVVPVKVLVKHYAHAEEMQEDIERCREQGYRVLGNPSFGPPSGNIVAYVSAVGFFGFLKQIPVWTVIYERF
jgi:hypothetical protein